MLSKLEQAKSSWGGRHTAVDNWLHERQELLVAYCKLAGMPPYSEFRSTLPSADSIESFCEILMDYVSAGHFEIYQDIVKGCEQRGPDSLNMAKKLYPQIMDTTDNVLNFHDKYADISTESDLSDLDGELSSLGQSLERRFDLEDKLMAAFYQDETEPAA